MAKDKNDTRQVPVQGDSVEDQAKQQTGGKQVRLRVDHTGMGITYANAFKTNATSEEVIVDLGLNMVVPNPQAKESDVAGDILFPGQQPPDPELLHRQTSGAVAGPDRPWLRREVRRAEAQRRRPVANRCKIIHINASVDMLV
ncbi:MAG: hypothetical protein R3C45_19585 [Phycisphaerales bacterium]